MPIPDLILLCFFGTVAVIAFGCAIWCFRKALKVATSPDGDLKMFFWAVGSMGFLIVAGMSAAYILFPIIFG